MDTTAVLVILGGREEPDEMEGELLRCLEELGLDGISRNPEVL